MNILNFFFKKTQPIERWIVWINREQEMNVNNNFVKTSKYTVYNFFFKSILMRLKQPLSLYFLAIAILQITPSISATRGIPTVMLPLFIVIAIDSIKDAYEDWQRHTSDRAENNRKVYWVPKLYIPPLKNQNLSENELGLGLIKEISEGTLNSLNLEWKLSSKIEVGDIILLRNREEIPADVVLLTSSGLNGISYVETLCLDGETNLKRKEAVQITQNYLKNDLINVLERIKNCEASILCNVPDTDLDKFKGTLTMFKLGAEVNFPEARKDYTININNIVMRGCILRNTVWALGVVVYTGHDTKIYMNMSPPRTKTSNLDILVNHIILVIFIIQFICCILSALVNLYYYMNYGSIGRVYLSPLYKDVTEVRVVCTSFFTWISITCNVIPISAVVTMNLVRFIQGYFISVDKSMYSAEYNSHTIPRNTSVNELLGQVQICFSDKTGTLTCNKMNFRKFSIEGVSYGKGLTDIKRSYLIKNGIPVPGAISGKFIITNNYVNLVDDHIMDDLHNPSSPRHVPLVELCLHFTVNNGISTEYNDEGVCIYSSASPDESTFAYAAKSLGIILVEKNSIFSIVDVLGRQIKLKIIVNMEFNNYRKRSSVICAIPKNNSVDIDYNKPILEFIDDCRIVLFTKGADSVMLNLVKKRSVDDNTIKYLKMYADDGLRSICFAKKELNKDEFLEWYKIYQQAEIDVENRYDRCTKLIDDLECDMRFQGVTGVEDKLQDGVADSIEYMTKAGIKTWMITGDNLEAAINIGLATNFIYSNSEKIDLTSIRIENEVNQTGKNAAYLYKKVIDDYITSLSLPNHNNIHRCLLIDGGTVNFICKNMSEDNCFIKLCMMTDTAICARMTPSNKGDMVSIIGKEHKMITLAIGDGANDCNMIQRADVGVGIKGNEGAQAFNVSDYGIAQFKFIVPLLLFHGRLTYRRMSKLVMYMFYKNILLTVPIWLYGFLSMFSGQLLYNDMLQQLFNIFFTAIPSIIFGSIEQDVDRNVTFKYPQLYKLGHINFYMNMRVFLTWILNAIYQSFIIISMAYLTFGTFNVGSSNGENYSLWEIGYAVFTVVFIVANVKLLLETYYLNALTFVGLFLSVFGFVYVSLSFNLSPNLGLSMRCVVSKSNNDIRFWLFCFVATMACIYRDYVWKVYLHTYRSHIYQSIQKVEYC